MRRTLIPRLKSKRMGKAHKRVEEKVDKLVESNLSKKQELDSHLMHDCVEEEDREEAEEIRRRANSVIIHKKHLVTLQIPTLKMKVRSLTCCMQ